VHLGVLKRKTKALQRVIAATLLFICLECGLSFSSKPRVKASGKKAKY